jgi:hypothetical protein
LPDVPHAVFFRLLALCLSERSDHRIKVPRRWEGSLKRIGRTRFDLVVRHTVQGVFPSQGRTSPCQWQCWRRSVLPEDRRQPMNRVTPHLRRPPHPARERDDRDRPSRWGRTKGNINLMGMLSTGYRKKCLGASVHPTLVIPGRGRAFAHVNPESQHGSLQPRRTYRDSGFALCRLRGRRTPRNDRAGLYPPISASHSSSVSTATPRSRALVSFEPASSPATT